MLAYPILLVFPVLMVLAAAKDVLSYTIPNGISLALIAGFVLAAPVAGLGMHASLMHVAAGAAVLAVGFLLFAFRLVGGGDAKLLAAASMWLGFEQLLPFLLHTAVIGGGLALVLLMFRRLSSTIFFGHGWVQRLQAPESGIPYGVAIAGGALMSFPKSAVFLGLAG